MDKYKKPLIALGVLIVLAILIYFGADPVNDFIELNK
jgi:hypothetical protein